jgi:Domain of unknown function (DUF4129)
VKLFRAPFLSIESVISKIVLLGFLCMAGYACPSPVYSQRSPIVVSNVPAPLDPAAFAAELRRLEAKLLGGNGSTNEVYALLRGLPSSWKVETPERRYEISSVPLRDLLARAARDAANRKQILEVASVWTENAATQAEGYAAAADVAKATESSTRSKLEQILKRREFSPPSPPTAWDLIRQRINKWLAGMFEKLFGGIARHPLGSKLLFWLVIFGVVCWLVTMLVQFWTRRSRGIGLETIGTIAAHRSWQEWIRAAQEAAMRGEFREAIHSLYWVGITRLEDLSILTVDHTRTPREQLKLLAGVSGAPASATPEQRARMAGLTRQLERVWYGHRPAGMEDFRECLKQVEDLGCRPT